MLFIEGDQEEELELAEGILLPVAQQVAKTRTNLLYDLLFFIAPDVRKYNISDVLFLSLFNKEKTLNSQQMQFSVHVHVDFARYIVVYLCCFL